MIESIYAEAFVGSVLGGDATLLAADALNGTAANKVFKNLPRQGVTFPVVVYNVQSADDVNSGNAVRLMTRFVFQVRVIGEVREGVLENASKVRKAAHRVDALLKDIRRQSATIESETFNFNVWRETGLPAREEPGATADIRYRNYGGFYVVECFT